MHTKTLADYILQLKSVTDSFPQDIDMTYDPACAHIIRVCIQTKYNQTNTLKYFIGIFWVFIKLNSDLRIWFSYQYNKSQTEAVIIWFLSGDIWHSEKAFKETTVSSNAFWVHSCVVCF